MDNNDFDQNPVIEFVSEMKGKNMDIRDKDKCEECHSWNVKCPECIDSIFNSRNKLRKAISDIKKAITEEEKMPAYHRSVMARHREEWGTLHNEIDKAIKALDE